MMGRREKIACVVSITLVKLHGNLYCSYQPLVVEVDALAAVEVERLDPPGDASEVLEAA